MKIFEIAEKIVKEKDKTFINDIAQELENENIDKKWAKKAIKCWLEGIISWQVEDTEDRAFNGVLREILRTGELVLEQLETAIREE